MKLVNPGVPDGSITPAKLSFVQKFFLGSQTANIPQQTWFTPAVSGLYLILAECVVEQAATTSSTVPQWEIGWTDNDANTGEIIACGYASTLNTLGLLGNTPVSGQNAEISALINAKAGVAVTIQTVNYASVGATPMSYALRAWAIGPF